MRGTRIGRMSGPGRWRTLQVSVAVLAAVGILGAVPSAVASASAQALDWTKQAPAASPGAQGGAAMAYDAATRTVVLFSTAGLTWTWDGTTWTKHHPKVHPPARELAAMTYDAATGTGGLISSGTDRPAVYKLAATTRMWACWRRGTRRVIRGHRLAGRAAPWRVVLCRGGPARG
jgi:hypothetical protein